MRHYFCAAHGKPLGAELKHATCIECGKPATYGPAPRKRERCRSCHQPGVDLDAKGLRVRMAEDMRRRVEVRAAEGVDLPDKPRRPPRGLQSDAQQA